MSRSPSSTATTWPRDSKDPRGPVLTFAVAEWHAFLDGIRKGVFERPERV